MEAAELKVPERFPDGWLPEDAEVFGLAEQRKDGRWEVILPEYSIAGQGDTWQEAVEEAQELLEDYLLLCAAEGMSFAETTRWAPARAYAPGMARAFSAIAWRMIRHRAIPRRIRQVSVTPRHVAC